jgi:KaiC/GvpD/RAD55 family RecA-like ATPase
MVSTGLEGLDQVLDGQGFPDRSTILVEGPPGVGKEALGYLFIRSGLALGSDCVYVTRLAVSEVKQDIGAFGAAGQAEPVWMAAREGRLKCDVNDLAGLSVTIKEFLQSKPVGLPIRIVTDVVSSLLVLHGFETVYRFLSQLFAELKQNNAILVATLEEGMHPPQVVAGMEQLFDGVMELRLYEKGLTVLPLLRIRKMRGLPPKAGFFRFSFVNGKMEVKVNAR